LQNMQQLPPTGPSSLYRGVGDQEITKIIMIKTRRAVAADLPAVQELNLKLFKKEFAEFDKTLDCDWTMSDKGEKYFSDRISFNGGCVFVAEDDDGKIVGYLAGGLSENEASRLDTGPMAELENMFVEDSYRGQKIGSALMDEFIRWCKDNNVSRVRVIASPGNVGGIRFYERNGFFPLDLVLEKKL